jgi:hypothetical protein
MNLYRRSTLRASLALLLLCAIGLALAAAQRKSQHKLRATALVELRTDARGTKIVTLIPITILDQGTFHDASIYKAAPEPLALGPGVVYEAEKTGLPVGLATVSSAEIRNGIWTAEGRWQPVSDKPKPKSTASPTTNPADERPVLRRSGGSRGSPQSTPGPGPTPSSTSQSSGGDDRPTLHRHEDEATSAGAQSAVTPTPTPAPETESRSEDPDRPTLRRGKPQPKTESSNGSAEQQASPAASGGGKNSKATSSSSGTQVFVAVSDAAPDDSRSFQFMWKPGEEAAIDAKLKRMAADQLTKSEGAKSGGPVNEQELKNVILRSFDLDLSNDAVLVLTAELPPPSAPAASKPASKARAGSKEATAASTASDRQATRYVTLITRVDLDGNPQVLAVSVTDSSRLDIAPRLELIDAVDVDGDGVGELLFRESDFDQKSFVIYAVRHGSVTKLFEGASQPLK